MYMHTCVQYRYMYIQSVGGGEKKDREWFIRKENEIQTEGHLGQIGYLV